MHCPLLQTEQYLSIIIVKTSACDVPGLTAPTGMCDAGYYCTGGAILQNPSGLVYGDICPVGHYCPSGTSLPEPCPAGTYLSTDGATHESDCVSCPAGRFCASTGLSNYTGKINLFSQCH